MNYAHVPLPAAFAGPAPAVLGRPFSSRTGFRGLPFVADRRAGTAAACWAVPASGGYYGGLTTGAAMAEAFLKFLRDDESELPPVWLTDIVQSFMARFEAEGGQAMADRRPDDWSAGFDSLRGQQAGFFNTLCRALAAAAKDLGDGLDDISYGDLARRGDAGLGFDHGAYMASLDGGEA